MRYSNFKIVQINMKHLLYALMPLINAHVDVAKRARGLNIDSSLHLRLYLVLESSKGSMHLLEPSLLVRCWGTEIMCTGLND